MRMRNSRGVCEMEIQLAKLESNPYNPRQHFDEGKIKQLASSIEKYGLNNPITVRKNGNSYQIAEGHRRVKAVKELGWDKIEVVVKDLSDEEMLDISVSENIQREDLTKVELATALQKYVEKGMTQTRIAEKIDKSQGYVSQILRTTELPQKVQKKIINRSITDTHGLVLLGLKKWYEKLLSDEWSEQGKEWAMDLLISYWAWLTEEKEWSVRELKDRIADFKLTVCHTLFEWEYKDHEDIDSLAMHWGSSDFFFADLNYLDPDKGLDLIGETKLGMRWALDDPEVRNCTHSWEETESGKMGCSECGILKSAWNNRDDVPYFCGIDHMTMIAIYNLYTAKWDIEPKLEGEIYRREYFENEVGDVGE